MLRTIRTVHKTLKTMKILDSLLSRMICVAFLANGLFYMPVNAVADTTWTRKGLRVATSKPGGFEFVLQCYAGDLDKYMLREAFQQDPNGDPDSVRWAAVTLCMQTLGFESMTGREFTPDLRDLKPAEYLQKMKKVAVDGTVESLWSPDYKAFQAIPEEDFQARLKHVREKSPDRLSERAGEWASKVWHGSQLSDDELTLLGEDVNPEDRALMDRENAEYKTKRKRVDKLRQLARDRKDVADYEAELMRQNAWATVAQASKGLESVFGEEIVQHALDHKGKLDPERLDNFSSMSLEDQRKVIPMLQALQEASDGRSWAGDIFGSFLGSVVEIPNRIALSSSAAWKRNVDGEATCDLMFEIRAMRKLATTAPVRDRGFLGNAFVHISSMLPYAGCAIPMQTNP